jgi:two-component system secretion response regulator SsrB
MNVPTRIEQSKLVIKRLGDDRRKIRDAAILVVADLAVVRRGLRSMVEEQPNWKVMAEASNRQEAVLQATRLRPDLVIADINMREFDGIEMTRSILKVMPEMRVLALSASSTGPLIYAALDAGVLGYVSKEDAETDLIPAANALLEDKTFFAAPIFKHFRNLCRRHEKGKALSLKERDVQIIQLLAQGKTNRETGGILGISVRTVEDYRAQIMRKLCLGNFSELVRYAVRNGIAEL